MSEELEKRIDELEHWKATHELEHKNLRDRLEQELRSKWSTDIKAMASHTEGILKKQDFELASIRGETERQTPLLEKTAKEFRANRRARHDRKVQEELYRTWMKRAVTAAIALGAVLEFIARVLPVLEKGP